MKRNVLLAVGALAVVLLIMVLVLSGGGGGPAPGPGDGGTTAVSQVPLDPGAAELNRLLARGRDEVWHARYRVTGAPTTTGEPPEEQTLEVWRRRGRARQDLVAASGDESVQVATFTDEDRQVSCRRTSRRDWDCSVIAPGGADADEAFARAIGELGDRSAGVRDDTVAGIDGKCFTMVGKGPEAEVCVTSDGVPLRIAGPGSTIEVLSLDRDVPDSIFTPPAPVG